MGKGKGSKSNPDANKHSAAKKGSTKAGRKEKKLKKLEKSQE